MNGSLNPFRFFRLCRDLQDVYLVCSSKLKICSTSAWSRGNQERGAAFQAIDNLGPVAWLALLSRFSAGFHPSLDQINKRPSVVEGCRVELVLSFLGDGLLTQCFCPKGRALAFRSAMPSLGPWSEENLVLGAAPVQDRHGEPVGLAAQAAATRGSRPFGLSPPLRGIEAHVDSPPTASTKGKRNCQC